MQAQLPEQAKQHKPRNPKKLLASKPSIGLFMLLFLHNTLLDIAVVTPSGVKLFINEALSLTTLVTHGLIASIVAVCYSLSEKLITQFTTRKIQLQRGKPQSIGLALPSFTLALLVMFAGLHFYHIF